MVAGIIIVVIIIVAAGYGLKETIKHSKGEGGCCGGGEDKSVDAEPTAVLEGDIVTKMDISIAGMHCINCKNSITRSLQKLGGIAVNVDLDANKAHLEATREVSDDEVTFAIERLDFKVTGIDRK